MMPRYYRLDWQEECGPVLTTESDATDTWNGFAVPHATPAEFADWLEGMQSYGSAWALTSWDWPLPATPLTAVPLDGWTWVEVGA